MTRDRATPFIPLTPGMEQAPGAELGSFDTSLTTADKIHTPTSEHSTEIFVLPDVLPVLGNPNLPAALKREELIEAVLNNPFVVSIGPTGSGKSTQFPQFLLGLFDKIYLTQPRRSAASNVCERIGAELEEVLGEGAASLASFQTAGEKFGSPDAPINIQTDGLRLVSQLGSSELKERQVIILDEVHEHGVPVEILLGVLKEAVKENPNLRVVITSADVDVESMIDFVQDVCPNGVPVVRVEGRMFDVERREAPETNIVDLSVQQIRQFLKDLDEGRKQLGEPNKILNFLPGKGEITDTLDKILGKLTKDEAARVTLLEAHSKLPKSQQDLVYKEYPGAVVICATDVAQTSLTIPGVVYVNDTGLHRQIETDDDGNQGLMLRQVSKATCNQRAGRTGRVCEGVYTLTRLDDKTEFVPYKDRDDYQIPEILRTSTARNMLRLLVSDIRLEKLGLPSRLKPKMFYQGREKLRLLGAVDDSSEITTIGLRMDDFPVNANLARMMVEADKYSPAVKRYMAAIAAATEVGGLQSTGHNSGREWMALTEETSSDLLVQLDLFIAIQSIDPKYLGEHDLDVNNILRAREQYIKLVRRSGGVDPTVELLPPSQEEREQIIECICAGMVDLLHVRSGEQYISMAVGRAAISREVGRGSVVSGLPRFIAATTRRVEYKQEGERKEKQVVEGVTTITAAHIGRVASHLTKWVTEGYHLRHGKFVEKRKQMLGSIDLGITVEAAPTPSARLREEILSHVLEHPGAAQSQLRSIKTHLQFLANIAKNPASVNRLTQDALIELIKEAITDDVTDPEMVDIKLRQLMLARNINLDSFETEDRRRQIVEDSPMSVEIGGVSLKVRYSNGKPYITNPPLVAIEAMDDELYLDDGRKIQLKDGNRNVSVHALKEVTFA